MSARSAEEFYGELSRAAGCCAIACLRPESWSEAFCERVWNRWAACGNQGIFPYLDERRQLLLEPFQHRPWAKSLLVFSFAVREDPAHPLKQLPPPRPGHAAGWIAGYATAQDYHLTGKSICEKILAFLNSSCGAELRSEWGVDASPVLEKQAAVMAGIGRQGWNGLLYDDSYGSQIQLGTIFLETELPERLLPVPDPFCPRCRCCEKKCPGGALLGDGQLAVRRCLSWLSGEKHGSLSWEEQLHLQSHVFGCSSCTTSCPGIVRAIPPDYAVDAEEVLLMSGRQLERVIFGTALQHMGASRLKRNCAAALGVFLSPGERKEWRRQHLAQVGSPMVRETILNWFCDEGPGID